MNITPEQAELIGMHVGDGTLYRTTRSIVWELRGGLNEKEYYGEHVVQLLKRLFLIQFHAKFRSGGKNGCFGVQTSQKTVADFFQKMGFKTGTKTYSVSIPAYIKTASEEVKLAFIRGYFDTDGCLRFERKNKEKLHRYPRIEFSTSSANMCEDLFSLLSELQFRVHKWGKNEFKISLAGKNNLEKFIKDVRPKNTKHLKKYLFWKERGYKNPDAAVA